MQLGAEVEQSYAAAVIGANWCEGDAPYGDGDLGTPGAPNRICVVAAPQLIEVSIDGFAMVPDPVEIQAGDRVRWTNLDGAFHTVTSGNPEDGDAGTLFDASLNQGESFEFTFEVPGEYRYFCRPHAASMRDYLVIVR